MRETVGIIHRVRRRLVAGALLENALLWGVSSWALALLFSIADYFLVLPLAFRRFYYYLVLGGGLYCCFRCLTELKRWRGGDAPILRLVQRRIPEMGDELLSAWQLCRRPSPDVSGELVSALVEKVEESVSTIPLFRVVPIREKAGHFLHLFGVLCLMTGSLSFVPPFILKHSLGRIVQSFSTLRGEERFTLFPGNKEYDWGAPATIEVTRKEYVPGTPELWLRPRESRWRKVDLWLRQGKYLFTTDVLTTEIDYYVVWGDGKSPVYTLRPVMPPRLQDISLAYDYPSYTGLPRQVVKGAPDISALSGSKVTVSGNVNKEVRSAWLETSWGKRYPAVIEGRAVRARMIVRRSGSYKILLEAADNSVNPEPPEYEVTATGDRYPEIELLSPRGDLTVAARAEIPLIVRAHDDFGISRAELVYQLADGETGRVDLRSAVSEEGQEVFTYAWNVPRLDLKPGARVRYYLEAWDNDAVKGPKSSVTPALTIEVSDYEREHERIESDLKELRQELLTILADQSVAHERLKKLQIEFSSGTYREILRAQRSLQEYADTPLQRLEDVLSRMESDPYTDFATHGEYSALKSHLEYLKRNPMPVAVRALEDREFDEASRRQEEIIAALEKMSLLSEDIWQYQKMRDTLASGASLEKAGRELSALLEQRAEPRELKKALDDIRDLLGKVNRQLSKLARELPEDFINSPSVKQIDLRPAGDLANELSEAIAQGDWEKAKELAASLQENLQSMSRTLEEAGQDIGFSSKAADRRKADLEKEMAAIATIMRQQEEIISKTEAIENARRQRLFRAQEGILAGLARRQAVLIEKAETVRQGMSARWPSHAYQARESIELMKKVMEEFRNQRAYHSQKYLEDIIARWKEIGVIVENARGSPQEEDERFAMKRETDEVLRGEKEILDALQKAPRGDFLGTEDGSRLSALSSGQNALSDQTHKVQRSLEEFTRKSALLVPEAFEHLLQARDRMSQAGKELSAREVPGALESERQALEFLKNAAGGIDAARGAMGLQGEKSGQGKASFFQMRSGGGATGVRTAPVELPKIDDYQPPRAFRQELLDALKERYPVQYEKMIKEYYRELAR